MGDGRRVTIAGKHWRLRYVPLRGDDGACDPPDKPRKEIRIARRTLRWTEARAEALLHEALHAHGWCLDEQMIRDYVADAVRLLTQEGCLRD